MTSPPVQWLTPGELRRLFNDGRYWERVLSGELTQHIRRNAHPEIPPAGEPVCTRSQIAVYLDRDGAKLAIVHQYLRPDGTFGASGQPDPKWLLSGGIAYAVRSRPEG
jgi:hypothetical protein